MPLAASAAPIQESVLPFTLPCMIGRVASSVRGTNRVCHARKYQPAIQAFSKLSQPKKEYSKISKSADWPTSSYL